MKLRVSYDSVREKMGQIKPCSKQTDAFQAGLFDGFCRCMPYVQKWDLHRESNRLSQLMHRVCAQYEEVCPSTLQVSRPVF